ncbi:MAG: hypothetical protein KJ058_07880 [Thermoanaerobaculia bacterium]|nr:hypothetical protein [Thermoanaerobaculia bacterium]
MTEQNRQMAALGRAVKKLTVALDQADAEISALRGRIQEAHAMLVAASAGQQECNGNCRSFELRRRWEATPEVQRALKEEPKP